MPAPHLGPARRTLLGLVAATAAVTSVGFVAAPVAHADIAQQIRSSQAKLAQLNRQAEAAAERYDAGREVLATAQFNAAQAKAALVKESAALAGMRRQIGAVAASAYINGTAGPTLRLMAGNSPGLLLDQIGTLDHISKVQDRVLGALATARHREAAVAGDARRAASDAAAAFAALAASKAQVVSAAVQAQQVLKALEVTQQQLVAAARSAAERRAAVAAAADLAAQSHAAAAASASFIAQPVSPEPAPATAPPPHHYSGGAAQVAVSAARDQLGKPYEYGAAGPNSFDCSGLTMYAYSQAGISIPHHAADQYNQGRHVARSDLQPGDLVFFDNLGHVGIYVGSGQFIHAPHSGTDVQYGSMAGYWEQHYDGAVRLAG
ncbi:MAG: hypothetical protein JWO12_2876 [Frankiales bacterium]|nr:hypothetical protein [Frankiales bacterium]